MYDDSQFKIDSSSYSTSSTLLRMLPFEAHLLFAKRVIQERPEENDPRVCHICKDAKTDFCALIGKNRTCGHLFCTDCIKKQLKKGGGIRCPTCRQVIYEKNIIRVYG